MESSKKQSIGFIGAGKAGISLGAYFRTKGLEISGYSSLSMKSALSAARITSSSAFPEAADLISSSEIIFISTPDSAIAGVWQAVKKYALRGKIICHLSGSLPSDLFYGIDRVGASGYSVHPMFAFSSKEGNFEGLEDACFTLEGSEERMDDVKEIFRRTENRTFVIDKSQKVLYHASNVMVSNLVTALLSMGIKSFEKCGVSEEKALEALLPLIRGNIENIAKKGFPESLTGPAERNDIDTIIKHLEVLEKEEGLIYGLLTKELAKISKVKHPDRDYSGLLKLFE